MCCLYYSQSLIQMLRNACCDCTAEAPVNQMKPVFKNNPPRHGNASETGRPEKRSKTACINKSLCLCAWQLQPTSYQFVAKDAK